MNCRNCQIMKKDVSCIPQGNDFKIAIALKEIIKADGETSERDIDIDENETLSVAVIKPNGDAVENPQNVFSFDLLEGTSTIILDFSNQEGVNALPKGNYGIDVKGVRNDADGSNFRFFLPPGHGFNIVNSTVDGRFPSDSIITYTVNGVVGVAQNVSSGGGGGGSATVGTLNTNNSTAQTPSASESFGGAINLHKVSKTGRYTDLLDKPTIPSKTSDLTNDNGFLTVHQDISGKEDELAITTPTITNNALTLAVSDFGKFFKLGTLTANTVITLPNMANESVTHIIGCIFDVTIGNNGGLDFNATQDIYENGLSNIEDGKRYEINVIYATEWRITAIELTEYNTSNS